MTAAVPVPRFRDQLAEALIDARLIRWREVDMALEYIDALMPVIAAELARVQAAANQRAVEELRAAADEVGVPAYWRRRLNARAAALACPGPTPHVTAGSEAGT